MSTLPSPLNVSGKVVAYFTASFCGPCQHIKPKFEEITQRYKNKIQFFKFELSDHQELADHLQVHNVPTFFFIQDGHILEQFSGANEARLRSTVAKLSAL